MSESGEVRGAKDGDDIYFGIDLGTSAVKLLATAGGKVLFREREPYRNDPPDGWIVAVRRICALAAKRLGEALLKSRLRGIGLSSQVGTYVIDDHTVIPWSGAEGDKELEEILERYPREIFLRETGMYHPRIHSYPLPRLLYVKRHFPGARLVCQPKEIICMKLTGRTVSDPYSWRGLADTGRGVYSDVLLRELGIDPRLLPSLTDPFSPAGGVTAKASEEFALPEKVPVYVGMNDFYCALIGMGADTDALFDVTGTSEHLGILRKNRAGETQLIESPFPGGFVRYGVTASAGPSVRFGAALSDEDPGDISVREILRRKPPVFLPYLNGERAPIFDSMARGVFFGIGGDTNRSDLAYAVAEGYAFSVYHIYETLENPKADVCVSSGGMAGQKLPNTLKATLLGMPVQAANEPDASAYGAALIAESGSTGKPFGELAARNDGPRQITRPDGSVREALMGRFQIYKRLYPCLKEEFREFSRL